MTTRRTTTRAKAALDRAKLPAVLPPPMPPEPAEDPAIKADILRILKQLTEQQQRENLANAVILAQQAAAGHGPLVEHFAELGRRFAQLTRTPKTERRTGFQVIEGGAA